ncbi:MAG: hypothetical protein J4G01_05830 [Dehalococcoidia bacterium]|nr:hypothetical protein [Dehalococcoidia bacterium]
MKPTTMAALLPILAAIFIVVWGGALGVVFTLLSKTTLHEWGPVILGMALVVGIPAAAGLLAKDHG